MTASQTPRPTDGPQSEAPRKRVARGLTAAREVDGVVFALRMAESRATRSSAEGAERTLRKLRKLRRALAARQEALIAEGIGASDLHDLQGLMATLQGALTAFNGHDKPKRKQLKAMRSAAKAALKAM